jgi:hypothetical protein
MKSILVLLIFIISLYSQDEIKNSKFEKNFISQGGKITPEIEEILKKDFYFKNAVIALEKEFVKKTIKFKDPENPNVVKTAFVESIPNYVKAYDEIKLSVSKFKNPLSAYLGLHLIKTVYGKNTQLKQFRDFSTLLYKSQKDICSAYIDYGETLENGYYSKSDLPLAKKVYKEGLSRENCKKGWYFNVLASKYENIKEEM